MKFEKEKVYHSINSASTLFLGRLFANKNILFCAVVESKNGLRFAENVHCSYRIGYQKQRLRVFNIAIANII